MTKPGTGCKDAPRCWSIQLTKVTNSDYNAVPTLYDDEFMTRHANSELALLATKHVDDVKVTGTPAEKKRFRDCLERAPSEPAPKLLRPWPKITIMAGSLLPKNRNVCKIHN